MAKQIIIGLCISITIKSSSCWEDPHVPVLPTLTIVPQPPDVVTEPVGKEIEYICVAANTISNQHNYLFWYQRKGNVENHLISAFDGSKVLTLKKTLSESDSGTDLYCDFWSSAESMARFHVISKPIKLMVVPAGYLPPAPTISVTPKPRDGVVELTVGDQIQFTCSSENLSSEEHLFIYQVKGNLVMRLTSEESTSKDNVTETKLLTNVTEADDNTKLYCKHHITDVSNNAIVSDCVTLSIRS